MNKKPKVYRIPARDKATIYVTNDEKKMKVFIETKRNQLFAEDKRLFVIENDETAKDNLAALWFMSPDIVLVEDLSGSHLIKEFALLALKWASDVDMYAAMYAFSLKDAHRRIEEEISTTYPPEHVKTMLESLKFCDSF